MYIMFHICLNSDASIEEGVMGSTSNFTVRFKKPLSIPSAPDGQWSIAFIQGSIPMTINNISEAYNNNNFYYSIDSGVSWKTVPISNGYYQVEQLSKYIEASIKENGDFLPGDLTPIRLESDGSRRRVVLWFDESATTYQVKFEANEALGELLGFNPGIYTDLYEADNKPNINRGINTIYVLCSSVGTGSCARNGNQSNVLYSINLNALPGQIMNIEPNTPLWVTLGATDQDIINELSIRIIDYRGRDVDFDGFPVTMTLGFKKFYYGQNE